MFISILEEEESSRESIIKIIDINWILLIMDYSVLNVDGIDTTNYQFTPVRKGWDSTSSISILVSALRSSKARIKSLAVSET